MKSPVQRLIWERKLSLLERRPVPAASEVNRHDLRRFAYMLIRSDWLQLANKGSWVDYGDTARPLSDALKDRYSRYILHLVSKAFYLDTLGNIARREQA